MQAIERRQLDSRPIAPVARFQWWQQCLTSAMYPVVIEPAGDPDPMGRNFDARFVAARLAGTSLTQGVLDPVVSTITDAAARQSPSDTVQLTVSERHDRYLKVGGEWSVVPAGTLVTHDATVPCTHRAVARDSLTMITVPKTALSFTSRQLRDLQLCALPIDAPSRNILRSAAKAVLDPAGRFAPASAEHFLVGAVDMVLRTVVGDDPHHADTTAARKHQALDYVCERLADPGLTLSDVAVHLQLSPRRLQQLFADEGGLSRVVRRMRIHRAAELLADPACALSIERIAARCGFTDRSAFSRACLAETGKRPSAIRDTGAW